MTTDGPVARPRVLSIAGSDSGGGAGIQADLKSFSALGAYGMTAITAVTVQNTLGVAGFEALAPRIVRDQIDAVASDIGVDAAKTGMLANAAIVAAVADAIEEDEIPNLVVDPVSVSKHGHALLAADAVEVLATRLLPLATVVTPNLPEAEVITGMRVETRDDMRRAAAAIAAFGPVAVLVKGGHAPTNDTASDLLLVAGEETWLDAPWIDTPNTHGTGCTLSAALAVHLARGDAVPAAVRAAKVFVTASIRHALAIGRGIGPVDQLWSIPPRA